VRCYVYADPAVARYRCVLNVCLRIVVTSDAALWVFEDCKRDSTLRARSCAE
jgi:hypothetical protein